VLLMGYALNTDRSAIYQHYRMHNPFLTSLNELSFTTRLPTLLIFMTPCVYMSIDSIPF